MFAFAAFEKDLAERQAAPADVPVISSRGCDAVVRAVGSRLDDERRHASGRGHTGPHWVAGLVVLVLGLALAVGGTASGAARAGRDRVWVDGSIHYWLRTVAATAGKTTTPLYAIAPVDRARPLHPLADARTKGFGAHDHVIADPHPNRAFVTVCNLTLVLPGPRSKVGSNTLVRRTTTPFGQRTLVYAVNLGNGVQPLTSAARIKRARQLGLATLSPIASSGFGCRIEPG